jgi:hypothetical protein
LNSELAKASGSEDDPDEGEVANESAGEAPIWSMADRIFVIFVVVVVKAFAETVEAAAATAGGTKLGTGSAKFVSWEEVAAAAAACACSSLTSVSVASVLASAWTGCAGTLSLVEASFRIRLMAFRTVFRA